MRKNDTITVHIDDMNDLGYGVGHIDGKAVFVRNAVTGDDLAVRIIKDGGSYFVAVPTEYLHVSHLRERVDCPDFPKCGGCAFCHITYDYEKELKRGFVLSFLRKEGLSDLTVLPVISAGRREGYRNKVQFPYADGRMGYYGAHSHRIVSGHTCALHHPAMQSVIDDLSAFFTQEKIEGYDEQTGRGLLRHVILRCSADGRQMLLTLVLTRRVFPAEKKLCALLCRHPEVKGMYYNVNHENTNVILGGEFFHVYGEKTITDQLLGCTFELSPASFYQVNHDACQLLYNEVIRRAEPCAGQTVADLFCGVGTIGICLARQAPDVKLIGVEIVPQAVADAKKNAARNGVTNAEFFCRDANDPAPACADAVIVDPPRKGLDEALIAQLSSLPRLTKIIYVSCNPATLARDLRRFRERGWSIGELQPVDMFPRTGHVETVVRLRRQNAAAD